MSQHELNTSRPPRRGVFRWAIAGCAGAALTAGALADPPPDPPPCEAEVDPLFCIRVTDIEHAPDLGENTYRVMLLFVNWTVGDAHGVYFALNNGTTEGPRLHTGAKGGVHVAKKGRPFCTMLPPPDMCDSEWPEGNQEIENCFVGQQVGSTSAIFLWDGVQTIPPATASGTINNGVPWTFSGLYDPFLLQADNCGQVISDMIPGSMFLPSPPRVVVPDPETIDDGFNVLDGFVLVIDDLADGQVASFNWWLAGPDKENPITLPDGSVDPMATGIMNLTNIGLPWPPPPAPPEGDNLRDFNNEIMAPPVPFGVNTGFNPASTKGLNNPRFWAEDINGGVAQYPINPIPDHKPGAGQWFGVEFGANVWAPFINPDDNITDIDPNINLPPGPMPCMIGDVNDDGLVNVADAIMVIQNMPPNQWVNAAADVNKDGVVDYLDLELVLTNISPCRPKTPVRPGVTPNQDSEIQHKSTP